MAPRLRKKIPRKKIVNGKEVEYLHILKNGELFIYTKKENESSYTELTNVISGQTYSSDYVFGVLLYSSTAMTKGFKVSNVKAISI